MSLHRLSAGTGYQYLLRHTACGDTPRQTGQPLTAYYTGSGYPPGRWLGRGLAGLGGDGASLSSGDPVSEEQMARLFGTGRDPVTGAALGRPYPTFSPLPERVARRVAALPDDRDDAARATAIAEIQAAEQARTQPGAVAGFDLTFSAPKSVSVLWGLGDIRVHRAVLAAHDAAVRDVLAVVEDRALFTRTGAAGCMQVPVHGMLAAAFQHWDSRTGDPQLHTHVVVANKVQAADGQWRSLDSRTLHHATVFASELYNDLLADQLSARLPVGWSWRNHGPRRSPGYEIDGIDDRVIAGFSSRTADIDRAVQQAVTDFHLTHGRRPNRAEIIRLRQAATLTTRPAKTPHRLTDLMHRWAATARQVTGGDPQQIVQAALAGRPHRRLRADWVSEPVVTRLAQTALADLMERRSTWTDWNVAASAARVTRGLRLRSAGDRLALLDRVQQATLAASVRLDGDDPIPTATLELRRPDGTGVFTRAGERRWSHPDLLAAETRLLNAHATPTAPTVPDTLVARALTVASADPGRRLAPDQAAAVTALATSGRQVDVLLGPAGTGKTTTLAVLRTAWEAAHGQGSVLGLAPSATAAHELGQAMGIECENVTKWLTEANPTTAVERQAVLAALPARRVAAAARRDLSEVRRLDRLAATVAADQRRWTLHPGQLVIVDEASLAGTLDLDRLREQAAHAGAKLLLVGDDHQLSAVDAGGAFRLLADTGRPAELASLWRFRHRWEADTTRLLRRGDPDALTAYAAHDRIRHGPTDSVLDAAYTAWQHDHTQGRSTILLSADTRTVQALNERAHLDRVADGTVTGPTIPLADGCGRDRGRVGAGDRVITRRNARHLPGQHGHVRNGDLWDVTTIHNDGSLTVTPARRDPTSRSAVGSVRLPAGYVAEHVDLGYALTVHRAQGVTVDTAHVLTTPGMGREALYVAMTRGRDANTVYVATDSPDPDCDHPDLATPDHTALDVLGRILGTSTAELSATETRRRAADAQRSLRRLAPIRATLAALIDKRRYPARLTAAGLPPATVQQLSESPAAGPLFAAMRRAEHLGHHAEHLVERLLPDASDATGDRFEVQDLAAVLHHRLATWLASAPDLTGQPPQAAATLGLADNVAGVADPLADSLDRVDALIHQRVAQLTDHATSNVSWLPAGRVDEPADRHRIAIIAAHRDLTSGARTRAVQTDRQTQQRARTADIAATGLDGPEPRRIA
jgi:conjugative relaxase-like TrwC/TraI family protein